MKKILFPTDFSPAAETAFVYALNLAKALKAEITTLHVYQLPDVNTGHLPITLSNIYHSIELEAFENYRDSVPELRKIAQDHNLENIPVNHVLVEGKPIPNIISTAKKENVDLIVMGTKGATGLKEVFVGSVAGEIMEKANCLVLGIPENSVFDGAINKIAMTTNLGVEDEKTFSRISRFASFFNSELHCIHINSNPKINAENNMAAWKSSLILPGEKTIFKVLESTHMESVISTYLLENKIDILVMVTHQRNFFQELFRYSRAKKMSYHLDTPVLAVPAEVLG